MAICDHLDVTKPKIGLRTFPFPKESDHWDRVLVQFAQACRARVGLDSSKPDILTVSAALGILCRIPLYIPVSKLKMRLYRTQSFEERCFASLLDWTVWDFRLYFGKDSTASSHMRSP
jgi:hypothetical protein